MPEVALDPKREFRRSMSDFKPGEIIPLFIPLQIACVCLLSAKAARMIVCHSVFKWAALKHADGWNESKGKVSHQYFSGGKVNGSKQSKNPHQTQGL